MRWSDLAKLRHYVTSHEVQMAHHSRLQMSNLDFGTIKEVLTQIKSVGHLAV